MSTPTEVAVGAVLMRVRFPVLEVTVPEPELVSGIAKLNPEHYIITARGGGVIAHGGGGLHPEPPRPHPVLIGVAQEIELVARYLAAAELLAAPRETLALLAAVPPLYGLQDARVMRISMGSPLEVMIRLTPEAVIAYGLGLILLAEKLATMKPRIARKRKEEFLRAALLDASRNQVLQGKADVLAETIADGPSRPERIDLMETEDDDDDGLEEIDGLAPKPRPTSS